MLPAIEKRITVQLSYQAYGHSYYAELSELNKDKADEIIKKTIDNFEMECKKALDEIKVQK